MQRRIQFISVLFIGFLLFPVISFSSSDTERVIIIISDSSVLTKAKTLGLSVSDSSEMFEPMLKKEVEVKLEYLRIQGLPFKVVDILTYVLHGAVIETSYGLDAIRSMTQNIEVYYDTFLKVNLEKSSELVGATETHKLLTGSGEPITGKGVVVAVLDTGVDYTHPDLGGSMGPDHKVIGGFDFVDNDEDPLDRDGHGTAVAGVIAADGQLTGIAPDTSILAYRVVDRIGNVKSTDLIRALERASQEGADVINLSLGTKEEIEALSYAIQNIVDSGTVIVAATGNSGENSFGEPAGRKGVIAVGATLNPGGIPRDAKVINNQVGEEFTAAFMNGAYPAPNGVTGNVVNVNFARSNDVAHLNLTGKIALAERGGDTGELVFFSEKEANVTARGAIGLIIYDNENRAEPYYGNLIGEHNPPGYIARIPVVSITQTDGLNLVHDLINGNDIEVSIYTSPDDTVAFFSSVGPISPFYLKPDIVAPGVLVNSTSINGSYSVLSGTSFAAPHVAGAAALLLQLHPFLTPELVIGILSPTSTVLTDPDQVIEPSSVQGSGRLDVLSAVKSPLALNPHYLIFQLAEGKPIDSRIMNFIPVVNDDISIMMDISWNFDSNISLLANSYNIDVEDNETSEIKFTASLLDSIPRVFEGRISLKSPGYPDLTIPVIVIVDDAWFEFTRTEDEFQISVKSEHKYEEAIVRVISPRGTIWEYNVNYGDSIQVDIPVSGEYSIEAEAMTSEGKIYARSIISLSDTFRRDVGIPVSFLEIFGSFMVLAVIVTSIMVTINRKNQKDNFGIE